MSALRRMKASDVMTRHVVTARPNDSISKVATYMEQNRIGSVVIIEGGRVVGILTERDFVRVVRRGYMGGRDRAKHHMTKPVLTVKPYASMGDIIRLMRKRHIRHLPVVDKRRRVVEIISPRNFVQFAVEAISV